MELWAAVEKMDLRGPKARQVLKENLVLPVLLERRYVSALLRGKLMNIDENISKYC